MKLSVFVELFDGGTFDIEIRPTITGNSIGSKYRTQNCQKIVVYTDNLVLVKNYSGQLIVLVDSDILINYCAKQILTDDKNYLEEIEQKFNTISRNDTDFNCLLTLFRSLVDSDND